MWGFFTVKLLLFPFHCLFLRVEPTLKGRRVELLEGGPSELLKIYSTLGQGFQEQGGPQTLPTDLLVTLDESLSLSEPGFPSLL